MTSAAIVGELQTLQALVYIRVVFRKLDEEVREGGWGLAEQKGAEIFGGHAVRLPEVSAAQQGRATATGGGCVKTLL